MLRGELAAATKNGIMKKLLVVAMLAMCCIACHSQECPYKFLGIPIEGTMDEFAKKLEEKGSRRIITLHPKRNVIWAFTTIVSPENFLEKNVR